MNSSKASQTLSKIILHIEHTMEYCNGLTPEEFYSNRMLQEACIYNVLQIGELAKLFLTDDMAGFHTEIPWHQMYGMRNRLAHDYEGIRLKTVWDTIHDDFPKLKTELEAIQKTL